MVEVRLEMGMGTMLGLWLLATGKELTEKVRMEIKKGGVIAIGSSWRNQKEMEF